MRSLFPLLLLGAAVLAQDYGTDHRLKIDVAGDSRKGVLFVPKDPKKGEVFPLLVAVPDTRGKAYLEVGQWQQPGYDQRFAVFSVDIDTSGEQGWHPKELLAMQRDMEAVTEGLKVAFATAREQGVELDDSSIVMTGHSGGTYLALWLGIRRPDLFLGVCGRSCVFHKETVELTKFDKVDLNTAMPIFLYHGEVDHPRVKKETQLAQKSLQEAGFTKVKLEIVPQMAHESKPEVFLEWYAKLLKETEKGRKESRKIRAEVEKLKDDVLAGRSSAYGKLLKLVEREKKAGVPGGAGALLSEVKAGAQKHWDMAADLEAEHRFAEAAELFRQVEKKYYPLPVAKEARDHRIALQKSDGFKAEELLNKAKAYLERGDKDRAFVTLEELVEKYKETAAAEEARGLLQG